MVCEYSGNGDILGSRLYVARHIVAHAGDTGFACLLDEHAEVLDALTLLLLLWVDRHAALSGLALQDGSCGGSGKIDDAGSTHWIGREVDL